MQVLRIDSASPFHTLIGVGGIGTGCVFSLDGNQTLGRNESRAAYLLDVRDYCKLHSIIHRRDQGPPDSHDSDSSGPTPLTEQVESSSPLTRTPP